MYLCQTLPDAKSKGSLRAVVSLASHPRGAQILSCRNRRAEAPRVRPTQLIVASRRDSSINWIRKAGKVGARLADMPVLRIAPAGHASARNPLLAKVLRSEIGQGASVSCLCSKQPSCAFGRHESFGAWPQTLASIGQTLPAGTNLDVQNQRFVVGASAFAFLDVEAFDLWR